VTTAIVGKSSEGSRQPGKETRTPARRLTVSLLWLSWRADLRLLGARRGCGCPLHSRTCRPCASSVYRLLRFPSATDVSGPLLRDYGRIGLPNRDEWSPSRLAFVGAV
jgi:hypothetical protein